MIATVIIPWIDSTHLEQAIRSAKDQTVPCELIVEEDVDRIGVVAMRNAMARRAHGEWLQFLDQDDWLEPWKIEQQINGAGWFRVDDEMYPPVDGVWCDTLFHSPDEGTRVYEVANLRDTLRRTGCGAPTGAWLVRRESFVPFPDHDLAYADDSWWQIDMLAANRRLRRAGKLGFHYRWNWSPNQISAQREMGRSITEVKKEMRRHK